MTLATTIYGSETRLRPLIKSVVLVTGLRAAWLAINAYPPEALPLAWALVPWPQHAFSWTVLAVDLALVFSQFRAAVRLIRLLLLRFAPQLAAFLGFSARPPSAEQHLTPRNRSWGPTAVLLCGILMLSCCVLTWIVLMLAYNEWAPFDLFMLSYFADRALLVGFVLSLLGLTFGGRYIARASGDVSTSFGVMPVEDTHWLAERVHGLAEQLNLPKPAVGVTNVMNAFAMGANQKSSMVVIGKPLFVFERDELDAVIGHELGHILHNDVARMQFAEGFQRMLVTVVNIMTRVAVKVAVRGKKSRAKARRDAYLAWLSGLVVRKTVFVASELVAKGISRNREFHADAVGAHVTSPDAMARALKRVHGVTDKPTAEERQYGYLMFRGAGFGKFFATHPPLEARLRALDAHAISHEAAKAAVIPASVVAVHGAEGLGLAGPGSGDDTPSALRAQLGSLAYGLGRRTRRGLTAFRAKVNVRRLATLGAVCLVLAAVAPAIVNFYSLDRRFNDAKASAGQALSTSWNWVADMQEAWFGNTDYTARVQQLEAREQAVKAAEARLANDRKALAQQTSAGNVSLPNALAERDQARRQVQDLLLKLDAANADRSALTARLAQQKTPEAGTLPAASQADMQDQIASLTEQLSTMTADRDEMVRRNDELRQMNLELKGQIADRDTARVDLDKQIQSFKDQIANLANGEPASQEQSAAPTVREAPATGGYGAFAAAGNGIVILTDRSFATQQAATDAALAECRQFSGGSQCELKQVFRNTCAAVARVIPATKRSRYELQLEATIQDAEEMALSECYQQNQRPCEVTRQVCVQ
ncbi:M48 family metalloprotease [Mesorhizobium ciceri]|uniref:M48 family metalloprotease n=1 Tax=Mesorhizobium ciceri TaxID=39645 RepID=UPI0007A95BB1|nr:M48 family metalloprotease [Mesorhizobium ciceri]AMY00721.1 hypothetical protein A4R29_15370 [Mesorhizobium ciceri biovar biserrulae]